MKDKLHPVKPYVFNWINVDVKPKHSNEYLLALLKSVDFLVDEIAAQPDGDLRTATLVTIHSMRQQIVDLETNYLPF